MKLKLKNFRCYTDSEFDFGQIGTILLSAPSGSGKSSLLFAINFALFGTGNKLVSYDKTSCQVDLIFDNFHITRTKRPNRVVLIKDDVKYEDATAQAIITEKFGKTFNITGYMSQNAINSFVLMTPLEKLSFLEKFAFEGIDIEQIKFKCKEHTRILHDQLIAVTSQYKMKDEEFKQLTKPIPVEYPLKFKKPSSQEKEMKNEEIKLNNSLILIKKRQAQINKIKDEITALILLNTTLSHKDELLFKIDEKLSQLEMTDQLSINIDDDLIKDLEAKLSFIMNKKELYLTKQKYKEDEKRLTQLETQEHNLILEKIKKIDDSLWKEYTEEELNTSINEHKDFLKQATRLYNLQDQLESITIEPNTIKTYKTQIISKTEQLNSKINLIKILKQKEKILKCPVCSNSLILNNNILEKHKEVNKDENKETNKDQLPIELLEKEIGILKSNLSRLEFLVSQETSKQEKYVELLNTINDIKSEYEDDIPSPEIIEQDLDELKTYKTEQNKFKIEKDILLKKLENKEYSTSFISLKNELKNTKNKIKQLNSSLTKESNIKEECENEEQLRKEIIEAKIQKKKIDETKIEINKLLKEKDTIEREIKEIKEHYILKFKDIKTELSLKKKLKHFKSKLDTHNEDFKTHSANMEQVKIYRKYLEEQEKYNEQKEKLNKLKQEEEIARNKYSSILKLKENIILAESISVTNIINSINSHVMNYLDLFFTNDPMSARLNIFKDTIKKEIKKPQINIQIEYKGMDADINMLSGGERDRLILAFTLGLSEIFNTPLLMLDECTSSLDQDLTNVVVNAIKDNFSNKLVIIIAHQTTEGIYDRVIKL